MHLEQYNLKEVDFSFYHYHILRVQSTRMKLAPKSPPLCLAEVRALPLNGERKQLYDKSNIRQNIRLLTDVARMEMLKT